MNDIKILWLFCWKKSPLTNGIVNRDVAKLIANLIPKIYFYTFTDCENLSGVILDLVIILKLTWTSQ